MHSSSPSSRPLAALVRTSWQASLVLFLTVGFGLLGGAPLAWAQDAARKSFDIPAGEAAPALKELAQQAGQQVVFGTLDVKGVRTPAVKGDYSLREALDKLLEGTPLVGTFDEKSATFAVHRESPEEAKNVNRAIAQDSGRPENKSNVVENENGEKVVKLDTFEVFGQKTLNMDLPRTRDDVQPYVVFDRQTLEGSGATSLEDFFKTRLPMNTVQATASQKTTGVSVNDGGSSSAINLRGLGTTQTLILVDGRRLPHVSDASLGLGQADVNGIPLSAIERVEVLPSTASGIYGGGATGGVVNIILKRDYAGLQLTAAYGNAFDGVDFNRKFGFTAGLNLAGGKTRLLVYGSHEDSGMLLIGERDFLRRSRALLLKNKPSLMLTDVPGAGTTPNIISNVYIGDVPQNLVLKPQFGGTALNAPGTFVPVGYTGIASDNAAALLANAGKYNLNIPNDSVQGGRSLLNGPKIDALTLSLRQELGSKVEAIAEFSRNENKGRFILAPVTSSVALPANAPNNPFVQKILVLFPIPGAPLDTYDQTSETVRALGGFIVRLPKDWIAEADYAWSRSRHISTATFPAVASAATSPYRAALANGSLDVVRDTTTFPIDFSPYLLRSPNFFEGPKDVLQRDATLRASGPVLELPAGALALSGSFEHRAEDLQGYVRETVNSAGTVATDRYSYGSAQSVTSEYLETSVPLIGGRTRMAAVRELTAQFSVRRDDYQTEQPNVVSTVVASRSGPFGDVPHQVNKIGSTDYTVGLRWLPLPDVAFRASLGTGFLPPSVLQIASTTVPGFDASFYTDPKRGGTALPPVTLITGGNPSLSPELSHSQSIGIVWTPQKVPGFRLSVDYTKIKKHDEIDSIDLQYLLNHENQYAGRVIRGPNQPGDLPGWAGPITQLDGTLANLARKVVKAFDFQLDYTKQTEALGSFHFYSIATLQTTLESQILPTDLVIDSVGFNDGPLRWRGNGGLTWERGPWTVGWNAQYYHHYLVYASTDSPATTADRVNSQGSDTIPSQTYHDLMVRYHFGNRPQGVWRLLANTEILLNIQNIFDRRPPILAALNLGDISNQYSPYGDPRLARFVLTVKKEF